ncbi:hypothetical protein GCM10018954_057030 [Kutzneria kofuensis]
MSAEIWTFVTFSPLASATKSELRYGHCPVLAGTGSPGAVALVEVGALLVVDDGVVVLGAACGCGDEHPPSTTPAARTPMHNAAFLIGPTVNQSPHGHLRPVPRATAKPSPKGGPGGRSPSWLGVWGESPRKQTSEVARAGTAPHTSPTREWRQGESNP